MKLVVLEGVGQIVNPCHMKLATKNCDDPWTAVVASNRRQLSEQFRTPSPYFEVHRASLHNIVAPLQINTLHLIPHVFVIYALRFEYELSC